MKVSWKATSLKTRQDRDIGRMGDGSGWGCVHILWC